MKDIVRIIRFTRHLWKYYALVGFFTIIIAGLSQLQPLFTKGAIDQITKLFSGGKIDSGLVILFAVLIFVSDFLQTIISNISGYFGDILAIKIQSSLSQKYFAHLMTLPQIYFDSEQTGTIINRMNRGISQIANFINMVSNNFLQFIFSTVFTLIIVFYYSWPVALMILILYPIFIYVTTKTSDKWRNYQKDINLEQDIAIGRFAEVMGQIRVVKSYIQEKAELSVFKKHFNWAVNISYPQSKYWHKQDIGRRTVLNVIFFIMFIYIFVETERRVYSLGTMVLLIQYALLIRVPMFNISFLVNQTQRAMANTKDYFDAMAVKNEEDETYHKPIAIINGKVEFKNVNFSYDGKNKVINDLSFQLIPGSKTALVGESGEGKTTISSLMLRFYNLGSGQILFDDQDISLFSRKSIRDNIAIVFQDPALFSGTIKENIAYSKPTASNDEIIAASKAANADEFITKLVDGYDSQIGERGIKLSGGQKQRIAIARAILKDAPILILDEATSSLDNKSEKIVQEALETLMKNRTSLIIAHRLSTIKSVDEIITLKNGRVDEIGSPSVLKNSGGIYSKLLSLVEDKNETSKKKLQSYEIND